MYTYAGYYQVRLYGGKDVYEAVANTDTLTKTALARAWYMDIARGVTAAIENWKANKSADTLTMNFMPYQETKKMHALIDKNERIDPDGRLLDLYQLPLMQLDSLTLGDGTVVAVATETLVRPDSNTPIEQIYLKNGVGLFTDYDDEWYNAIEIGGIWGHRTRFATEGFVDSADEVEDNPLAIDATEITVNDAASADSQGNTPRFDVGQILQIEDEYVVIMSIDYTTKKLTVARGQQGTTAAEHAQNTQIDVFIVEPAIMRACAIATAFEWQNVSKFETVQAQIALGATNVQVKPELWPASVGAILREYVLTSMGVS